MLNYLKAKLEQAIQEQMRASVKVETLCELVKDMEEVQNCETESSVELENEPVEVENKVVE